MHWVYILKCEDDVYYVGETTRLYRRFWEHTEGRGGLNTFYHTPESIVAIYKVDTLCKFFKYNINVVDCINNEQDYQGWILREFNNNEVDCDKLEAENNIVECLMVHSKKFDNIRGGKYVRFDIDYKFPVNKYVKNLPLCNCRLPCDVKQNEDKKNLFFRCAKKNMWGDFKEQYDIVEAPCKFYMEYTKDKNFRLEEQQRQKNRKKTIGELFSKSSLWLENVEEETEDEVGECVSCNKYVWCDKEGNFKNNAIDYCNRRLLLCFDCFIDKNEELSKIYSTKGKCLIQL